MNGARLTRSLHSEAGRTVDVWIFAPPPGEVARASIVFSHGANASPDHYRRLLEAWAAAGFLVCAPLHTDSEDHPERVSDSAAIRAFRLEDFALVAAALGEGWCDAPRTRFVAAGHSYGALIAQVASGARLDVETVAMTAATERPSSVIALSPPPPMPGLASARSWSTISVPMLCVTGTADEMPGFVDDWRLHLASHEAAQCSFAAVFDGMDHYFNGAFGRLREPVDAVAVDALNRMVIAFASDWACADGLTAEQWLAERTPGVQRLA